MTFLFSKTDRYLLNFLKECKRVKKLKNVEKRYLVLAGFVLVVVFGIILSTSGMARLSRVQSGIGIPENPEIKEVPVLIAQDARVLSEELFGQKPEAEQYYEQLIAAYQDSVDKDLLIIFNAGGWGTKTLEDSTDWISIMNGILTELQSAGFKVATWNFQRTTENLGGQFREIGSIFSGYYSKARDLAQRIEFLTDHITGLRVILAGESTGTMICDSTMNLLKENERIYSIQTGVPPWQINTINVRTVVVNDNGVVPDAFSQADLGAVVKSNFKLLIGDETADDEGKILTFLSAPGHEYWWQHSKVSAQIGIFLGKYFGVRSGFQGID